MKRLKQISLVLPLLVFTAQAKEWYVAPAGAAGNDGSQERPFASLVQARDAVRAYNAKNPDGNETHTIYMADGKYRIAETAVFEASDSGSAEAPITYKAQNPRQVFFSTGPEISVGRFRRTKPNEEYRLKKEARGEVIVADIKDPALVAAFGKGRGEYSLLTWNEHVMQLAQWPNRAYNHIEDVIDMGATLRWLQTGEKPAPFSFEKPCGGTFTMTEQTDFAAWNREIRRTRDIYQDGFLSVDWTKDAHRVARVSDDGVIQLLDASNYGVGGLRYRGGYRNETDEPHMKPFRRLVFKNVLCELDMPGEWYFDRLENKLYLWPIDKNLRAATIAIPSGPEMIALKDASHLSFEGIVFQNGGESAISISGGSDNRFAGCVFRNLLGRAGSVSGSRNGFLSCDFYNMDNCLSITGGDYKTLTRADNYVINCEIRDLRHIGYGSLGLSGCGIIFKNNRYHNIASGILYSGMYIEFENNEFYDVGWGMGDWNVLYQGATIWCNGNLVKNNFFHHMFEQPGRYGIRAVRNDDGGSGTTYESNIFYKTGAGAITYAGPNSHMLNNISLGHGALWYTVIRPITKEGVAEQYQLIADNYESGKYPRGGKGDEIYNAEQIVGEKGWEKEPFKSAFPNFARYMNENPFAQSYGSMLNNYSDIATVEDPYKAVAVHGSFFLTDDDGMVHENKMDAVLPKTFKYNAPMPVDLKEDFVDYKSLNFTFKSGFKTMPGFVACDLSRVGLYQDAFRPNPPNPTEYRSALYRKWKFRPSGNGGRRYNPTYASKYYPWQSWVTEKGDDYTKYPYLSALETEVAVAHNTLLRDTNFGNGKITIGGKEFDYGLIACPTGEDKRSSLIFDLSEYPKAKRFSATIGIDDLVGDAGSCAFIVRVKKDDKWVELYRSPVLTGKDRGLEVDVDLQGSKMLQLVTTDGGNNINADHSAWADAKIVE